MVAIFQTIFSWMKITNHLPFWTGIHQLPLCSGRKDAVMQTFDVFLVVSLRRLCNKSLFLLTDDTMTLYVATFFVELNCYTSLAWWQKDCQRVKRRGLHLADITFL